MINNYNKKSYYFRFFYTFFVILIFIPRLYSINYSGKYIYNDIYFHKKIFLPESDYELLIKKKVKTMVDKITSYITNLNFFKSIKNNKRSIIAMLSIWLTTITTTFPFMYDIDRGNFI